jgi:hypothetical protein
MRPTLRRAGFALHAPAIVFLLLWLFVGAVSAIDTYFTVRFAPGMHEENPIGDHLIRLGTRMHHAETGQDVSLFVGVKMFTTILVLGTLMVIYQRWPTTGQQVAFGLALFQLALLIYLLH